MSRIEMIDMEPVIQPISKGPVELITEIIKYLFTIEDDEECLKQWKDVEQGIKLYNIGLTPMVWSTLLDHKIIGKHIRELHPEAEKHTLDALRDDDGVPTRWNKYKKETYSEDKGWVTVEQYIEYKGWVKVNR